MHDKGIPHRCAPPDERFWARVRKTQTCWLWTGRTTPHGYGIIGIKHQEMLAHRFSWQHHFGPIPAKTCVLHRCDVTGCVNPSHLFLGTLADNNRDRQSKGRTVVPFGETHHLAKLTSHDVLTIRSRYAMGTVTQREIAAHYGVEPRTIHRIVHRKTWKHL